MDGLHPNESRCYRASKAAVVRGRRALRRLQPAAERRPLLLEELRPRGARDRGVRLLARQRLERVRARREIGVDANHHIKRAGLRVDSHQSQ